MSTKKTLEKAAMEAALPSFVTDPAGRVLLLQTATALLASNRDRDYDVGEAVREAVDLMAETDRYAEAVAFKSKIYD